MIHRPQCDRPPLDEQPSSAIRGLVIARCPQCRAVALVDHRPRGGDLRFRRLGPPTQAEFGTHTAANGRSPR